MNPLSKKKGDYVKVPLPYGLNVFYVIGNSLMNANQGITDKGEVLGDIFTASLGSFSPLNFPSYGSDATSYIFKVLAPTLGQPIISLVANENFFGRTIYSEENPWSKSPRPASELGRDRFKKLVEDLNLDLVLLTLTQTKWVLFLSGLQGVLEKQLEEPKDH